MLNLQRADVRSFLTLYLNIYRILLYNPQGDQSYMTKDQLKEKCPLAFAISPTNPKVSGRYLFVNTETIVDDLDKLGWKPVQAAQRKSRGKSTIFSKHMVAFQNPDIKIIKILPFSIFRSCRN